MSKMLTSGYRPVPAFRLPGLFNLAGLSKLFHIFLLWPFIDVVVFKEDPEAGDAIHFQRHTEIAKG